MSPIYQQEWIFAFNYKYYQYPYHQMSRAMIVFAMALLMATHIHTASKNSQIQKLSSGKLYFQVKQTPSSSAELFQVAYDSRIKSEIKLTQSSKIQVQAKLKFTSELFNPEVVAFRLRNENNDRLTEPVQMTFDSESESYRGIIDFGDPKTIKPYSDLYNLQFMIADDKLESNVRNNVAAIRVAFRYSMREDQLPHLNTPIAYPQQSIINNPPPEARIDPPQTFTTFILILMGAYSIIFLYGLFSYLKANFKNLPTSSFGLLLNLALIALVMVNLVFLIKFWLTWNFITTIKNFFWLILLTAFVANYALHYIKINDESSAKKHAS